MTPLQIEILMHYKFSQRDFSDLSDNLTSAAAIEEIGKFLENGALVNRIERPGAVSQSSCQLGERGQVFVDYILSLELPKANWQIPGVRPPAHE